MARSSGRTAPLAVVQPVVGRARKPSFVQWRTIPCRLDVNGDKGWGADIKYGEEFKKFAAPKRI
jgi:hypothetical protein